MLSHTKRGITMPETTEEMLSRMAAHSAALDAASLGIAPSELRNYQRLCAETGHVWVNHGLYDECLICKEGRA